MENRTEVVSQDLSLLQDQYGILKLNNKRSVLELDFDQETFSDKNLRFEAFETLVLRAAARGDLKSENSKKLCKEFLDSPDTPLFTSVRFDPTLTQEEAVKDNVLNLWQPPKVIPGRGDWSTLQDFIQNVICGGVDSDYEYLMNFLAHAWQVPEEKPGVLIGLQSNCEAAGRSTFMRLINDLWGDLCFREWGRLSWVLSRCDIRHKLWVCLSDPNFVRGNAIRRKALVQDSELSLKGWREPYRMTKSFHRVVVRAPEGGFNSRQMREWNIFAPTASSHRQWDYDFWGAVNQARGSEVEALAHHIATRDISSFDPRVLPANSSS